MRPISVLRGFVYLLLLAVPFVAASQEANHGFRSVRQILETSCSVCHDWAATYEGIADPARVTPGSPEKSPLYTTVASKEAVFRLKLGVPGFDYNAVR